MNNPSCVLIRLKSEFVVPVEWQELSGRVLCHPVEVVGTLVALAKYVGSAIVVFFEDAIEICGIIKPSLSADLVDRLICLAQ